MVAVADPYPLAVAGRIGAGLWGENELSKRFFFEGSLRLGVLTKKIPFVERGIDTSGS